MKRGTQTFQRSSSVRVCVCVCVCVCVSVCVCVCVCVCVSVLLFSSCQARRIPRRGSSARAATFSTAHSEPTVPSYQNRSTWRRWSRRRPRSRASRQGTRRCGAGVRCARSPSSPARRAEPTFSPPATSPRWRPLTLASHPHLSAAAQPPGPVPAPVPGLVPVLVRLHCPHPLPCLSAPAKGELGKRTVRTASRQLSLLLMDADTSESWSLNNVFFIIIIIIIWSLVQQASAKHYLQRF